MKGATMLGTLQKLGMVPSFSRPSVSNDNPYSESLFGTLKYTPAYPSKPFDSLETARGWMRDLVRWHNEQHRHSGIQFVTPGQRHRQADPAILRQRSAVYERARERHPERWRGSTRNWTPVSEVWLNPDSTAEEKEETREQAAYHTRQLS
jgi:putative transposase